MSRHSRTADIPSSSSADSSVTVSSARRSRRAKRKATVAPVVSDQCRECLEQAEVCREQARVAVGLKRYGAARGLFATAMSLCQRALGLRAQSAAAQADAARADEIDERMRQLTIEMAAYSELTKSMERPLRSASASFPSSATARGN